jgi:hypothetical protein
MLAGFTEPFQIPHRVANLLHLSRILVDLAYDGGHPDRLAAQPFQPFIVYTADGREYGVPTHDHGHVSPGRGRVRIWADGETEYILRALLISGLRVKPNGQHKP